MIKSLYPKLAFLNIRKNGRLYIPYILSSVITIAMFYVMCSITFNKDGIAKLQGATTLQTVLYMGIIVIAIFSFIFLFYTNSFLMKRRKKEVGLFNILGMEKRHISRIMFWEVLITSAISIASGLLFGILFDKLATLILMKILRCNVTFGFHISGFAIVITVIGFFGIFFMNLLYDIAKVRISKPIELLHGSNVGEKEPKTKWILAVLGIISLAAGYTIALMVESPLDALALFFVAVILVIVGTYFLFIAGSIALLKVLRKNKKYYYNPKHFTSVSGMIYRMKQNAVGLANICILSTMVLVMLSTTVCMYIGADDAIYARYPKDINLNLYVEKNNVDMIDDVEELVEKKASQDGRTVTDGKKTIDYTITTGYTDNKYSSKVDNSISASNIYMFCIKSVSQYKIQTGESINLKDGDVVAYTATSGKKKNDDALLKEQFILNGMKFNVISRPESFEETSQYSGYTTVIHYVVVSDNDFEKIYDSVNNNMNGKIFITTSYSFNVDGDDAEKEKFNNEAYEEVKKLALSAPEDDSIAYSHESRASERESFYSMYGSFLFLGIYLGTMFLMITALIMYYKQISEGFDDKHRFEIMQQVGMSKDEIKKSIHSQVITVFFMPLIAAIIHIAFAFKMITKLMVVLNLSNVPLFLICTIGTAVVFAVIYAIVYALTARSYYKIVE